MDTRQTTEKHRLLPSAKNDSVTSGQMDDSGQEEVRKATKRTELGENSVKRPEHSTERLQYSTEGPEYSTERLEYSTEGPEYSTERLEYSTEGPEYSTERLEYSTKGPEYSVARVLPDRELSSDTVVPPPRSKRKRLMLKQLSPSSGDISGVDRPSTSVDYLTKPRPFELTESRSVTTVPGASVTADGLQNATTKCNSVTSVGLAATSITTASGRAGSVTAGSVTAGIVTAGSVTTSSVTAGSVTIACVTAGGAAGGSFSVLTSPGITKPKRQLSMPVLPTSLSPPISPTSVTSSKSSGSESPRDVNFNKPLLPSTAPPKPPVRRTSSSSGYLTTCLKTNTTKSEINTSPTRSVSTTIIPSNGSTTKGQTLNRQVSNSVNSVNSVNNDVINNDVGSLPCKHEDSYSPVVIRRKLTRLCFKDDDECVGFASLPEQVHRKAVKRGFDFTLMVVGETGLGKSTLITSLFLNPELYKDRKLLDASERVHKTVEIEKKYMEIEEKGVKLRLTIVDTPGFNDCMDAEQSWQPIEKYIIHQFDQYLKDESGLNRKNIKDHRVHCCLYFISPYGHGLRQIDITFIKRLQDKVNIVPIIAKADTLTPSEVRRLKERILEQIDEHRLQIYEFPDCDSDEDEDFKKQDAELKAAIPFAVIGSNTVVEVNGRKVRGRLYPWGVVEVDNPQHCDFTKLRMMLISTHMQDLKDVTRDVHYENFRANQIKEQLTKSQRERNKLKRDSSPNFECIMDQSQLLEQKEEEIRRMQEMIVKMQAQLQNSKRASSAVSNGSDNP